MHPRWHAAAKVALGSFMIVLVFGTMGVTGAILGRWTGVPRAASTPEPGAQPAAETSGDAGDAGDTGAGDTAADAAAAPAAAAASGDVVPEETALQDGLELPSATAAEVLASRFPALSQQSFAIAMVMPHHREATGSSDMLREMVMIDPVRPDLGDTPGGEPPAAVTAPPAAVSEPETMRGDPAPPRHGGVNSSARSPYVLNDAMIASIKRRLRLTAEQEKLWSPVEAALRKLVYTRAALNPQHGQGPVPYIDPTSSSDLKTAAMPLIMRLNEGQRREVRDIVHVMGLTAVASQM